MHESRTVPTLLVGVAAGAALALTAQKVATELTQRKKRREMRESVVEESDGDDSNAGGETHRGDLYSAAAPGRGGSSCSAREIATETRRQAPPHEVAKEPPLGAQTLASVFGRGGGVVPPVEGPSTTHYYAPPAPSRSPSPDASTWAAAVPDLDVDALNANVLGPDASPEACIRWAVEAFGGRLVMSTSFGMQSAVLLHMATRVAPSIPVVWIDTGYLHRETYLFARHLTKKLGLNLHVYQSDVSPARMEALHGRLWQHDDDVSHRVYGVLRKVEPMNRAVRDLRALALLSGVRKGQTAHRETLKRLAYHDGQRHYRVHPLLHWTKDDVDAYIAKHKLPYHPLKRKGYVSVGDAHSTTPSSSSSSKNGSKPVVPTKPMMHPTKEDFGSSAAEESRGAASRSASSSPKKIKEKHPRAPPCDDDETGVDKAGLVPKKAKEAALSETNGNLERSRSTVSNAGKGEQNDRATRFGGKRQECGLHTERGDAAELEDLVKRLLEGSSGGRDNADYCKDGLAPCAGSPRLAAPSRQRNNGGSTSSTPTSFTEDASPGFANDGDSDATIHGVNVGYEIYGRPSCKFCEAAKRVLTSRGIPFVWATMQRFNQQTNSLDPPRIDGVSVVSRSDVERRVQHVAPGSPPVESVPQIFVDGDYVGGFADLCVRLEVPKSVMDVALLEIGGAVLHDKNYAATWSLSSGNLRRGPSVKDLFSNHDDATTSSSIPVTMVARGENVHAGNIIDADATTSSSSTHSSSSSSCASSVSSV